MIKKTLIIGSGSCAGHIAEDLLSKNLDIIIAAQDKDCNLSLSSTSERTSARFLEILTGTKLLTCHGAAGNFRISMSKDGEKITRTVANIIVAEEARRKPNFSLYNLTPSDSVLSFSRIKEYRPNPDRLSKSNKIVFLTGLLQESNPLIQEEIMRSALDLQLNFNLQTYILTQNLKVAGNGLEVLYRKTKEAGTIYFKFSNTLPKIDQTDPGSVTIDFFDEILQQKFQLTPDITIVDEKIYPSEYLKNLAEIFGLDSDEDGFLQTDNVHRISIFSNRKGIMVAGPSRGIQSPADHALDAGNAAISTLGFMADNAPELDYRAEIDPGSCVRCLTCYRLCPHRAIMFDTAVTVMSEACQECGICMAECPRNAIQIKNLGRPNISELIQQDSIALNKKTIPLLAAFCCRRSAGQAKTLAEYMGHKLPQGLSVIEVPCAGSVSLDHIFSAFKYNSDGVIILTCHAGNCYSERGNTFVKNRANRITDFLSQIGFPKERILIQSLASNMGMEFYEITKNFEKKILKLGTT